MQKFSSNAYPQTSPIQVLERLGFILIWWVRDSEPSAMLPTLLNQPLTHSYVCGLHARVHPFWYDIFRPKSGHWKLFTFYFPIQIQTRAKPVLLQMFYCRKGEIWSLFQAESRWLLSRLSMKPCLFLPTFRSDAIQNCISRWKEGLCVLWRRNTRIHMYQAVSYNGQSSLNMPKLLKIHNMSHGSIRRNWSYPFDFFFESSCQMVWHVRMNAKRNWLTGGGLKSCFPLSPWALLHYCISSWFPLARKNREGFALRCQDVQWYYAWLLCS